MSRIYAVALVLVGIAAYCSVDASNIMTGDMFTFAQFWQPELCYNQSTSISPHSDCAPPQEFWKTSFTVHGLWPQYFSGPPYPQNCTSEAFDPNVPVTIGWSTMTKYWPDAQYLETDPLYNSFWEHEWAKHGTCTGLSQLTYFQVAIDLLKRFGTPSLVSKNVGGIVSSDDLRAAMGGATYVALQCDAGNRLNGAFTCWSESKGVPFEQIECPSDVQAEDTCVSPTVIVTAFK